MTEMAATEPANVWWGRRFEDALGGEVVRGRRACSRLLRSAWKFPAILLSSVLMLITAGLPATATPGAQSRSHSIEADRDIVVTSVGELSDTVVSSAPAANKIGYVPPTPSGHDVDPLDLYLLQSWGGHTDRVFPDSARATTDPDRGPPVIGQQ